MQVVPVLLGVITEQSLLKSLFGSTIQIAVHDNSVLYTDLQKPICDRICKNTAYRYFRENRDRNVY